MSLQRSYDINPEVGFPGSLAEPNTFHRTERGVMYVPANGTTPRPGMGVIYSSANDGFALPTTDALQHTIIGILGYRADQVAASDSRIGFANGDEIEVFTHGVVWVTAGAAAVYGQILEFQRGDQKWDGVAQPAAFADMYRIAVRSRSFYDVANGDLVKAEIGYGGAL